jgi:outer membrane receptor protein involved in Fe transport
VNLKGVTDVNLGFEYRYNKFLSLYLDLRNVANQRYQRWYGYPTQKFNFMAGLTYTF